MGTTVGKRVGTHLYVHIASIGLLDQHLRARVDAALALAPSTANTCNVIKLEFDGHGITLLDYPDFFVQAFPVLRRAWTIDPNPQQVRYRSYEDSLNPPILHRKELLLPPQHPDQPRFRALTEAAEQIGLFDDPNRIGFQRAWASLLVAKGYRVVGHELVPIGNDEAAPTPIEESPFAGVARHRTALTRYALSAPIQTLARHGLLDGSRTLFDYGCGKGDDLRGLRDNGIEVRGWDPYFAPDEIKVSAHLVNLGFVINVIEDLGERIAALHGAWGLATELLVVSAMLANQETVPGTPYGDGILTARNTFQKYYSQTELRQFIAEVLDEEPIPVGPGIFYVFKDKDAEQRFQSGRQRNRRALIRLTTRVRPPAVLRTQRRSAAERDQARYAEHQALLDGLWSLWLSLGREPQREEIPNLAEVVEHFSTLPKALRFIHGQQPDANALLTEARQARTDDLRVYLALLQFGRHRPYRHLEPGLQRDLRHFFGGYEAAVEAGRELLFRIAETAAIDQACREAAEQGIGWLEEGESLQLHTSLVERLPPLLRVYIGCGTQVYGDVGGADLIKVHIRSGKLTLMTFDDFEGSPLPRMTRRVKLRLREQGLDLFDYEGPFTPPYIYRKSRFINEEFPGFAEQVTFEEQLDGIGLFDFSGYGPSPEEFDTTLEAHRYAIDGFRLVRSQTILGLDAPCGRFLTYRQVIECGETQARTGLPNLPKEPDSFTALHDLALNLLDPLIDWYGSIRLTYGFCSPELAKSIPGRIAPKLDQHAAHERNRLGNPICPRLGAAVDFLVEDEDMLDVARWISANLPFDRMYLYGPDKPIHLSYGPERLGQVTLMIERGERKGLVPRVVTAERLEQLSGESFR